MAMDARIPLLGISGREAEQLGNGILTGQSVRANEQQLQMGEVQAQAAKRQKEMEGLTAVTNALAYLDQQPEADRPRLLENIKRFSKTAFDDPNGYIDQITMENVADVRAAMTPYADQLKQQIQMGEFGLKQDKSAADVRYVDAGTSLRGAQEGDIWADNRRADWKTGSDIENSNRRTGAYVSGVDNANRNRDAGTALDYDKAYRTGYGQLGKGQMIGPDGVASDIPGYTPPPSTKAPGSRELPAALKKNEDEDASNSEVAGSLANDAEMLAQQLDAGMIDPGAARGAQTWIARNTGLLSTENTDAYERLSRFTTRYVNESLRLNKGVQTEGDAKRALNEIQYAKDGRAAAKALRELAALSRRSQERLRKTMNDRRSRNGVEALDFGGDQGLGSVYEAPSGSSGGPIAIQSDDEWEALAPGTQYVGPDGQVRTKR